LQAGKSINGLALESALWCRYCYGTSDSGKTIEPNDPIWPRLTETAHAAKQDPGRWLAMDDIYGNVGNSPVFQRAFSAALDSIWKTGVTRTIQEYLSR
jgi:mannitol 2-dehydrogenase